MANITVRDLTAYSDSEITIRDLSEEELDLKGGNPFLIAYLLVEAAQVAYAIYSVNSRD